MNEDKEVQLDDTDRKIIDLLIKDGRMSYADIGKELDLSRVAVRTRINTLIETGVIEQFTCIVDSEKVGRKVSAFFNVDCEPNSLVEVAENLANNPFVASCYQMTGPSTLHTHVLADNFNQLESFINNELYALKGITRVDSQILLRRFKSRTGFKL